MIYEVNGRSYSASSIRNARIEAGLSRSAAAKKIGVSVDTLANIERGYRIGVKGPVTLPKILKALKVEPIRWFSIRDCANYANVSVKAVDKWIRNYDDFPEVTYWEKQYESGFLYRRRRVDRKEFVAWFNNHKEIPMYRGAQTRKIKARKPRPEIKTNVESVTNQPAALETQNVSLLRRVIRRIGI